MNRVYTVKVVFDEKTVPSDLMKLIDQAILQARDFHLYNNESEAVLDYDTDTLRIKITIKQ